MADLPFTLDQLRILRAIVSEGSFKKAADSLYVTQPAVSLQIQNLEQQLEVSLFDRGGRQAQLTGRKHAPDRAAVNRIREMLQGGEELEADDLEAINILYPDCSGAAAREKKGSDI